MSERRPGRPPYADADKPARVHVTIPPKTYDQARSIARREGLSVPELMRRSLARTLSDESDEDE